MPVAGHVQQTWSAFGYVMQFRWSDPGLASFLGLVVLPGWEPAEDRTPHTIYRLHRNSNQISIFRDEEHITTVPLETARAELKRQAHLQLATFAPDAVFVHAGVVLAPSGLILLPGRSWAGKSSLVRALVRQGCRYYSDEFAVVHNDGFVSPFARPLSQRNGADSDILIPPGDLGWTPDLGPAQVAAVVSVSYRENWIWEVEKVGAGKGMLQLIENTVSARIFPEQALQRFPKIVESALCLSGRRGEAEPAARALLARVRAHRGS